MPELIYEGHVYIAMPPLYKVIPKKGEEEYLYDDKALEKYRKTHKGHFTLQRYKGLGEMDAEQLWETTLDPETRLLKRVEIEDARHGIRCDGDADGHRCAAAQGSLSTSTHMMRNAERMRYIGKTEIGRYADSNESTDYHERNIPR